MLSIILVIAAFVLFGAHHPFLGFLLLLAAFGFFRR